MWVVLEEEVVVVVQVEWMCRVSRSRAIPAVVGAGGHDLLAAAAVVLSVMPPWTAHESNRHESKQWAWPWRS